MEKLKDALQKYQAALMISSGRRAGGRFEKVVALEGQKGKG